LTERQANYVYKEVLQTTQRSLPSSRALIKTDAPQLVHLTICIWREFKSRAITHAAVKSNLLDGSDFLNASKAMTIFRMSLSELLDSAMRKQTANNVTSLYFLKLRVNPCVEYFNAPGLGERPCNSR